MSELPDLTQDELNDSAWGEPPEGWKLAAELEDGYKSRWQVQSLWVLQRLSDMTFWKISRMLGLTENQEHDDAEVLGQVTPVDKTVVQRTWEPVA